jgi:hypothetical protein
MKWDSGDSVYHLAAPSGAASAVGSAMGQRISPGAPVDRDWARGGRLGFRSVLPHPKGVNGRRYQSYY